MTVRRDELAYQRCSRQGLTREAYLSVREVVSGLLGVQAQEPGQSRWALAQRLGSATDDDVRSAIANAEVVRVHVLRPTWHYVLGSDLRWLQALTHGAVRRSSASWYRNHGVDERFLESSKDAIGRTLEGGRFLTRAELREALGADGLDVSGQRLTIVLFDAELDSLICSGPLAGKHHTYALVDERVPPAAPLSDDEATALLIRRYLYGHGPATLKDLRWWCNLTLKRIRSAVETLGDGVIRETIDGVEYLWLPGHDPFADDGSRTRRGREPVDAPRFQMLGVFDELLTGYSESRGLVDPDGEFGSVLPLAYGPLPNLLLEGDRLVGQWRADRRGRRMSVSVRATRPFSTVDHDALSLEVERYAAFRGDEVELVQVTER